MKFKYENQDLFNAVNQAIVKFFLGNLPADCSAAEIRARAKAYASAVGRFAATTHPDFESVEDLRDAMERMEIEFIESVSDFTVEELRPGGRFWSK
ncbi:hypothetical protein ACIPIN_01855 [Pseudomonas sp. NPDC087697]|uniref:hypothetical protein n=1 Tax=Pseudomonas sp. NPDC087697 TaxID=3364447 RepID=UPI003819C0B5